MLRVAARRERYRHGEHHALVLENTLTLSKFSERSPSPELNPVPSKPVAAKESTDSACTGIRMTFPAGQNQHISYPFGLHDQLTLPWNFYSEGDRFFLRSTRCRQRVSGSNPGMCKPCHELDRRDDNLHDIRARIADGINENTPLIFFPVGGLIQRIRKKNDQLTAMRLTKLNDTRMLAGKIAELDLHKQLMMAIASNDVHRVSQLICVGLNNGESIGALLERFYRACVDVHQEGPKYNPKGFTPEDYMVGLTVLRLGGARLAEILHRALGLPGLATLRKHSIIRPLRASPAMPTIAEIKENIDAYTAGEEVPTGAPRIVHRVIMLDEIAVEKRMRWDDKTNMMLGACREHSHNASLEFCALSDATTFFEAVDLNQVHFATEATVIALGSLAREPKIYNPRPICISGTCKQEKGDEHAAFLRSVNVAVDNRKVHGNITYRTVSVASKDLMQNRAPRLSTDRTKRVAGLPAFANQSATRRIAFDNPTGAPSLRIGNPIATLVECEGKSYLAVAQVNTIISGAQSLDSILLDLLSDRVTKISYQIFQLVPTNSEDEPDHDYDWKWSLGFESSIRNVPGHLIHPLNPTVKSCAWKTHLPVLQRRSDHCGGEHRQPAAPYPL
ncbi:hypothetical protein DFH06DRAFT_986756 [Mycena polygramma]|nr:hypothetical protein DFH06DRAFT_986756 [Mycena polygramma]